MRMIGLCACLFLAGTGWRTVQAHASLSPLQVHGQALDWEVPALDSSETQPHAAGFAAAAPRAAKKAKLCGVLNPNQASFEQLQTLPGVGPALAARLVAARAEHPFRNLQDLDQVKGIGPAKLETLRPHLIF